MNSDQREEMIQLLVLVTGWNRTTFENMIDSKIEEIFEERVESRG